MLFRLLWVCILLNWGLELEYARLSELIPWLPALQSVPVRQSSFSALNTTNSPALRAKAGLGGYPPGIELGGSERVVRAAGQAAKRNPAPPSSVEKTRAAWRWTCHEGFSGAAHIVEAARGKNLPALSLKMERKSGETKYRMYLAVREQPCPDVWKHRTSHRL